MHSPAAPSGRLTEDVSDAATAGIGIDPILALPWAGGEEQKRLFLTDS
jgi:hypothetical protein